MLKMVTNIDGWFRNSRHFLSNNKELLCIHDANAIMRSTIIKCTWNKSHFNVKLIRLIRLKLRQMTKWCTQATYFLWIQNYLWMSLTLYRIRREGGKEKEKERASERFKEKRPIIHFICRVFRTFFVAYF